MRYVIVRFSDGLDAYRECTDGGVVVRYADASGVTVPRQDVPIEVLDSNPAEPAWAVAEPTPDPETEYAPAPRRLTRLQFIDRLGDDYYTILAAAKSSVMIEGWVKRFELATPEMDGTSIDLDDPRTIGGLQALESAGLIAPGRAAEILA